MFPDYTNRWLTNAEADKSSIELLRLRRSSY